MPLDMKDPYDAHAYFALLFQCDRCGRELEHNVTGEIGEADYCSGIAAEAKAQGWFCPEREPDGSMHVMFCLCPDCAIFKEEELRKTQWQKLK